MDSENSSSNPDSEDYELLDSPPTEINDNLSDSLTATDSIFRELRQNFRGESQSLNDLSSGKKIVLHTHFKLNLYRV